MARDFAPALQAAFDILYAYMPPEELSAIEPIREEMIPNFEPDSNLDFIPRATRSGPLINIIY